METQNSGNNPDLGSDVGDPVEAGVQGAYRQDYQLATGEWYHYPVGTDPITEPIHPGKRADCRICKPKPGTTYEVHGRPHVAVPTGEPGLEILVPAKPEPERVQGIDEDWQYSETAEGYGVHYYGNVIHFGDRVSKCELCHPKPEPAGAAERRKAVAITHYLGPGEEVLSCGFCGAEIFNLWRAAFESFIGRLKESIREVEAIPAGLAREGGLLSLRAALQVANDRHAAAQGDKGADNGAEGEEPGEDD